MGQKQPNPWGLYDMYGNVWEWVEDEGHSDYDGAPTDGSVWEDGRFSQRVDRSGSWSDLARFCRPASRNYYDPGLLSYDQGFRLLQDP